MSAIPIGFIVGGPIAAAILGVNWLGLRGWRWLFLLEGIPAIVFGMTALLLLPDWPKDARWLPAQERDWISRQLAEERRANRPTFVR